MHTLTSYILKIHFNIIFHFVPKLTNSGILTDILYAFLSYFMHPTWSDHPNNKNKTMKSLITWLSSSICYFLFLMATDSQDTFNLLFP
jgi:hypothetical protein